MTNSLLDWLRGPSRSMRHRFIVQPRNWASYLLKYKLMGRSRLDYWADLTDAAQLPRMSSPLGQGNLDRGRGQFEYMIAQGLMPTHVLLDYGCGPLLGGRHFAEYLEPGNYVGADISRRFMQRGSSMLTAAGIPRKNYHLVKVSDFDVADLQEFRFDFVLCDSAFQYVSDKDFQTIMTGIRKTIRVDVPFHFTFPQHHKRDELRIKGQHYRTPEAIEKIVRASGYRFSWTAGSSDRWPGASNIGVAVAA